MSSDATRVISPYRIGAEKTRRLVKEDPEERLKRARIARDREIERVRLEEQIELQKIAKAAAEEEIRRNERARIKGLEDAYKKKQDRIQKEYLDQKEANAKYSKEEENLKTSLYEQEYQQWKSDVTSNPDDYALSTRAAVIASEQGPAFDAMARLLFGLKNRAGNVAINSIDTNGTRYQGEISRRQHAMDAAKIHQYRVGLEQSLYDLQEQQSKYSPTSQEYAEIQQSINNINAQLNDQQSKQFDDYYKQDYVINKSGIWDLMKKTWRNYVSGFTYDQYKDLIAERNYKQDVDQYYNTLVDNRNQAQKGNKSGFLYEKINPYAINQSRKNNDRTLQSYSPRELLDLDSNTTDNRVDDLTEELKEYQKLYKENRQHLADSQKFWQVSEYFKHGVNAHQNDALNSLGYWGYSIYPMIGSTFSSPEQLYSTVGQMASVAGQASAPWTGGAGTLIGLGAGILSGYYGIKSGFAENTTEAGDKRIQNFKDLLSEEDNKNQASKLDKTTAELIDRSAQYWRKQGWSEEQIDEYLKGQEGINHAINDYLVGLTKSLTDESGNPYVFAKDGQTPIYTAPIADPAVERAELYSTQGLQALYEADNARTVASNIFQTLVTIMPTGTMRKAANVVLPSEGAEVLKGSFSKGAVIGEMAGFGVAGEVIGGSAYTLGKAAAKLGVEKLPAGTRNLFRSIEQKVMHKYQDVYDKLLPKSKFGKAAAIYGARSARIASASMMSEAAEEAAQYLNSKEDYAAKYGWGGMSIADAIFNDIYQGARIFNSYGALLGITESELLNDAEYWTNAQGGFALGGIHTGTIRAASEIYNAYREIPVHAAILESAVMNRELDKKDRASNVEFAKQAMRRRTAETLSVLDWMQKNDSRREEPMFTEEDYAEKRKAAERIGQMTQNKVIRSKLEAKGFVYGTEEYANAVADLYSIEQQAQQNRDEQRDKSNSIIGYYNSKEYQEEADAIVEQYLNSDFEETMGVSAAMITAGNEAVAAEIKRATEAGEDTSTSDFKKHLQTIRKDAQEAHNKQIRATYRNSVLETSHIAHKLQSLIKLRQQHKSINDFFSFIQDKFNLRPKRGDAKLITQNVDEQIREAKEQLRGLYEEFDPELSDEAVLEFIENLPIVRAHSDEIERREISTAMLKADEAVIRKHADMFEEGLVRTPDGKYQYNPRQYKAQKERSNKLLEQLRKKELTFEQYMEQLNHAPAAEAYVEEEVKNNPYSRRIKAIMDARKDDESLEHMMHDIEYGDGVVKILEELEKEDTKTSTSDEAMAAAKEESETFDFERGEAAPTASTEPVSSAVTPISAEEHTITPRERFERRKKRANENYKKRKKTLRDLRKNAYAAIVPIPTPLLDLANYLMTKGQIGTYKIAQFAEELKNLAKSKGFDARNFLSGIKSFYIDKTVEAISEQPDLLENFSSNKEIVDFHFQDEPIAKQPAVIGSAQDMQDLINEETAKINTVLSTHYDTVVNIEGGIEIYPNREAIVNARFETNVARNNLIDELDSLKDDEQKYREYVEQLFKNYQNFPIPINEYVKYRNVDGMSQLIANMRYNQENEESVQNGKRIRNAVVSIMLNQEDKIDREYFLGDFDAFVDQIRKIKKQITSKENGKGLTILDTMVPIYGVDYNGMRISSEADIIATDGTKIYIIDVRYSFQSPREYWNIKYKRATFTIGEHVTRRLKQIEQIVNTKFKRGVNGLYCLPVIYDPSIPLLTVDYSETGAALKEVKPDTNDPVEESLDELKKAAVDLANEINNTIDEYNIISEEARKYSDVYLPLDLINVPKFDSQQEYVNYINTIHAKYDTLQDRIDEMRILINQRSNLYDEIWQQRIETETDQQPVEYTTKIGILKDACSELDILIDRLPILKITTEDERNTVEAFIDCLFRAQLALDDVLSTQETNIADISAEQNLISTAIEKLAENEKNIGKPAIFAKRWWATQFVVGVANNFQERVKTENDMFFGYKNRIDSWLSVGEKLFGNIDNNYALQQWYSTLMNNYFNVLLNNAEKFANEVIDDAAQRILLLNSVKSGRDLIDRFNGLYDVRPDDSYSGPSFSPEVDKINRMPVRWNDLYGTSNSIMPSFNEMGDKNGAGKFYYYLSTSPWFLDESKTKMILSQRRDGKVQIYIEGPTKDGSIRNVTLSFENDITKARPQDVERWQYVNVARQKFLRKIIAALNFVKNNPGYEIRFDRATNKGQIRYNEDGRISPVTEFAFADEQNKHNLYTIKLSKEDRVGVFVRISGDNIGPDVYNIKGGDNLLDDIGGFDRDYQKQKVHIYNGALVYFYNTGNNQYIGIPIQSQQIGLTDATKLVDLIQKYISGDRVDQYGFNIMELLRLRLYMADPERKITRRNNINNMVSIENGHVVVGKENFDIVSQKNELINRIATMQNVTRADMLNQYMRTSNNSVLSRVRILFANSSQLEMQLTNGLVFNKEDFTHHNEGTNVQDGSTWLGYMMRNNLLGTSATVSGYKELRISNIRVVPKGFSEEQPIQKEVEQANKKPKIVVKEDDFFDKLAKLRKIVDESELDVNRSVEQQESFAQDVMDYFDRVLGINGRVDFGPTDKKFLMELTKNERVAGLCTTEFIKLSRYVPMSIAWHEAFHKIFELVIPAKERDTMYHAYKWGRSKKLSDREVAEAFADMFMTYMQNKQAINKTDGFFKKIKPWFKMLGFTIGMALKIGPHRAKQMFRIYHDMNKGLYRNIAISKEQNERFENLFGYGLYYTVTNTDNKHSAEFSHIADIGERDKLVRGLSYFILRAFGIDELNPNVAKVKITGGTDKIKSTVDKLAEIGNGAVIEYLKNRHPVFEEVFEKVQKEHKTKDGKTVMYNYYPKFDALSRYIADYISSIFDTMRKPKIEDDDTRTETDTQDELSEGIDFKASDTDHWDKAAYEFSKLDGLMDEVKLFFGTIPYGVYDDVENKDGTITRNVVTDYSRNEFAGAEFRPIEEVWNLVVNRFHTASSIEELDKMLKDSAPIDPLYAQIYKKFHTLVSGIYKTNESGVVVTAQTNFDKESFALQILSAIQSQKNIFLIGLSEKQQDDEAEGKSVRIVESSMDRDARMYPDQWNRYLVSGQIGVFQRERGEGSQIDSDGRRKKTELIFREGMGGKNGSDIFSRTAKFFVDLRQAIISSNSDIAVDGVNYDLNSFEDLGLIKDEIVHRLNTIGIMFERGALDYMLSELYGGVDADAVGRFLSNSPISNDKNVLESEKKATLQSFINKINSYVSDDGRINQSAIEQEGYGKMGFVNKLANWQGKYKRMSSQNMAYALNGKKLYSISQNNSISHIVKQLNSMDMENPTVKVLSGFGYNITRDEMGLPMGSIILKALANREVVNINTYTYIGFKTDNKQDQGSEYTDEATVEDYIAKLTMLQQGYLIFPTLADKGTWMLMDGVNIPGMRFIQLAKDEDDINSTEKMIVDGAPTIRIIDGKPYLIPNDATVDQMIEYAKTELLGIQQCMEDLGYEEIPGYVKTGRKVLSEEEKIENYHTKNKDVEPNGTRFLSLTAVTTYEYDSKEKKYKLVTHNLNDPRESSVNLLKRAQKHFFARREGESMEQMIARQRETMALTLAVQTQNEVNTAVQLGIVQKTSYSANFGSKEAKVSDKDTNLMNLDSKDLNILQIQALQHHFMTTTRRRDGTLWQNVLDPSQKAFYSKMAKSLAIAAILQDATNRHIICSQEVQRCFSGHPALFKVKYGKTGILDSAYDIQKRIGGLVSTGEDNITSLPGIKPTYVCAECNDYEIASQSNIANRLEQMFGDSNARYIYGCTSGRWDDAYSKSIDELEKDSKYGNSVIKAKNKGRLFAKSFTGGINVADGAAYITADMCRDMLRMRGAYNNKVRKAFKILMSSSKYSWTKTAEAYKEVYNAINIVPTKYTAYGFRQHSLNGSQVSDIAVAYYNKFALFPIFPCMATGKMEEVYNKMISEGVDMLLMTSAVKVGSQGAVSFDGETISKPFNKYEQDYSYLRRQLNTDPEDKDENHIGTQMMKIGLSNLVRNRTYIDLDGKEITGDQILRDMMSSINELAGIGAQEVRDMFMTEDTQYDDDGNIISSRQYIDYKKMSEYLNEQLTARNANKTIIQAIQTTPDGKKLSSPLAATPDAAWIESIFISTMNKHIVDITTPGKSFVQRSIWAMEGDSEMSPTLNRGQKLQMINEDHSMDAVISIDYFKDILPEGLSFEQSKQWLIDNGIISGYRFNEEDMSQEWFDAEAVMIGYRIPTQAQSSIHALRIVDVLPATKTTIILPEEFTKITGSDFDIDHLYLASFNFRKDENGMMTRSFDVGTKEYHQNKILEMLMILLKDTENSLNHLYKPIDNDTELVTDVSDYIEEHSSTKDSPYNFGTLHEQVIRKNDYITGKKGIAPFALNSTSHALCRLYGVKFKRTLLVENTRLANFDGRIDKDNNPVESWLSGFINAHVDIVKDPYISRLNVNPFTYNMLNLMIRCGWGDTALWFLANPVIRSMAQANDLADSQYMRRSNKNKTGRTYREELILNAVKQYLTDDEVSDERLEELLTDKKQADQRILYVKALDRMQDKLRDCAVTGVVDHDTALVVFYAWKILEKYSIALGNLVQHTKVDTRKYGKNFIAVQKYYSDYKKLFRPSKKDEESSIWDISSLRNLERGSWIGKKTDLVANMPIEIFGGLTFNANKNFVNAVIDFSKKLERGGKELSQDDFVQLSRHLQTAIKSKYFVKYAHDVLKMSDKDIADLFVGYRSMNRQLVSLKDLIANDPKYARLASNPFLNQIYSMLEDKPVFANGREMADKPGFVTVLDNVDDSKLNSDLLSEGWLDLMNDEDGRVSKFAKKMVLYAFFTSGEFKGWNKLLKYVPYEWISGEVDTQYESYSEFIEKELQNVSPDYSDLYDDIVANNFMDYKFAEQTTVVNEDGSRNFLNDDRGVRIGKGVTAEQVDDVSEYVSILKKGMRYGHQDSYELYKKLDVVKQGKLYYPVYVKIKKRGYHTRGNDIYEYGWNFNYAENEAKGSDTFDYESAIQRVKEFIKNGSLDSFSDANVRAVNKVYAKPEAEEKVAPKKKEVEPGSHIATRGYKKGDPQRHPEFNYVFTENAEAYAYTQGIDVEHGFGNFPYRGAPKINVSDVNGTNQAGIRTDEKGNITPNAYGIVVKKYQQDENGNFVAQEGTFKDTDEDFDMFTSLNEDMFNRLQNSQNKVIIFPQQMALGKAALPKRFAEWLRDQLLDRFGVVSEVVKNVRPDYDGYGLNIIRAEPKESNLNQDREYDWKYEEDSGYSGILEELPPKVRMNGGMTYRPRYDFGRLYLTDNERKYITENINIVDENGDVQSINTTKLGHVIESISDSYDHLINKTGFKFKSVSYKDWKTLLESSDKFEEFVMHRIINEMQDFNGFDYTNLIGEYNKSTKTIQIEEDFYNIVKVMSDNIDAVDDLIDLVNNEWVAADMLIRYENIYDAFEDLANGEYEDSSYQHTAISLQYTYSDKRQQELFSDEDFELTEEEQKEAKRYKKACEGE